MTDGTVAPVRVMMVDDDPFILTVFAEQLDAQPSVSVCATAAGGGQALKTLSSRSHRIDVVLLDISMPDLDGIQTARAIHKQYPELPLVVFTAFSRDDMLAEALAEGVNGFITKDESAEDVATAVVRAARGKHVMSVRPTELLASAYQSEQRRRHAAEQTRRAVEELPPRLKDVHACLLEGTSVRVASPFLRSSLLPALVALPIFAGEPHAGGVRTLTRISCARRRLLRRAESHQ